MAAIFIIIFIVVCYEIVGMEGYAPQVRLYLVSYSLNYLFISLCG